MCIVHTHTCSYTRFCINCYNTMGNTLVQCTLSVHMNEMIAFVFQPIDLYVTGEHHARHATAPTHTSDCINVWCRSLRWLRTWRLLLCALQHFTNYALINWPVWNSRTARSGVIFTSDGVIWADFIWYLSIIFGGRMYEFCLNCTLYMHILFKWRCPRYAASTRWSTCLCVNSVIRCMSFVHIHEHFVRLSASRICSFHGINAYHYDWMQLSFSIQMYMYTRAVVINYADYW